MMETANLILSKSLSAAVVILGSWKLFALLSAFPRKGIEMTKNGDYAIKAFIFSMICLVVAHVCFAFSSNDLNWPMKLISLGFCISLFYLSRVFQPPPKPRL